jgi:hypothetical protein
MSSRTCASIGTLAVIVAVASVWAREDATIRVASGGDLQAALDRAVPGTTILLESGGRYEGNFVLPATPASATFITIRTDAPGLPGPGERTGPVHAGALATLASPSNQPTLRTASGAHHWRIENVAFGANAKGDGNVIELGQPPPAQRSLDGIAHDLILDRVYVRGDPALGQKRGIALNSGSTRIVNSYIADIKAAGIETQAIAGWNGPGPYVIENNYLEAAGVNVMFGGADPSVPNLVPTDITIRGNTLSRPVAWRGSRWTIKNLLELKNARQVLIEGNTFENHWTQAQAGYAILFTPRNQNGTAPWALVEDVRFVDNVVRHVAAGINISGTDDEHPSGRASRITIMRNRFEDVNGPKWGGPGDFLQIGNAPADIRIERNMVDHTGRMVSLYGSGGRREVIGFVFRGNVLRHNRYGIIGADAAPGRGTFERYLPGAVFEENVIGGGDPALYPGKNRFVPVDELRLTAGV